MRQSPASNWPMVLPGFEHVGRMWDIERNKVCAKVMPGQIYVSRSDELISTVLGSCVAACIRDPDAGVGGMNHFMLPGHNREDDSGRGGMRYGRDAMDQLIAFLLDWGASRARLEIKLFGGGAVMDFDLANVGDKNITCARSYCRDNALSVAAEDLGGDLPRKVVYDPQTGRVMVRRMRRLQSATVAAQERDYLNGT